MIQPRNRGDMFPFDSVSVGAAVTEVVQVTDVTALGCIRGYHEWHVILTHCVDIATKGVTW